MAKFFPEAPPFPLSEEQRELLDYVFRELNRISVALFTEVYLNLEKKFVEPTRPQDGDVSYADGTSWNPGAGAGIYAYVNSAWTKLNLGTTDDIVLDTVTGNAFIFPATFVDNASANALDDYEEGTWTPVYLSSIGAFGAITYDATRQGTYTKIGNTILIRFKIVTDNMAVGTAGGQLKVGGLPFTAGQLVAVYIGPVSSFSANAPWHGLVSGTDVLCYHRTSVTSNSVSTAAATDPVFGAFADGNSMYGALNYRT